MEMPTPCENCGDIFDLNDGKTSPRSKRRHQQIIICASCANEEQEEVDREDEIESLREQISEAMDTLSWAKERLRELGEPFEEKETA